MNNLKNREADLSGFDLSIRRRGTEAGWKQVEFEKEVRMLQAEIGFLNRLVTVRLSAWINAIRVKTNALCNLSAKIWNTPELHTAQPLDYLSQFPWTVTEANTRYSVTQAESAMLPIP